MNKRSISIFILLAYCGFLIKVMVFKDMPTIRIGQLMLNFSGVDAGHSPNFVPFKTIFPYLLGHKGWMIAMVNLLGNILLLVPVGFLIPFLYRNITWKKSLLLAIASGLVIELMQTVLRVGIFDIDDVILNALGVMIGYFAFVILEEWVRLRKYKRIIIAVIVVILATAGAFYAIYPKDPLVVPDVGADGFNNDQGNIHQGTDPCNGTGGTGQIIGKGTLTITIRRNDGAVQTIQLTDQTMFRNSSGPASESDLKIGDKVTVVVDASETAATVLVCNVPAIETHPGSKTARP